MNNLTFKQKIVGALLALVALLGGGASVANFGSVEVGNQYQSTSTPQVADATNLCPARPTGMASSTTGVLGSVNILASGAGTLTIYDATTTDNGLRVSAATTSLILADFPASATVGSYHFDIGFQRGLLVDYTTTGSGVSSTTISYRCEL